MNADILFGHRRAGFTLLVGLALVAPGLLGECRGGDKPKADVKPAAKLIDAIVSRNKPPKIVEWKTRELRWAALFPEGYDWKEEARVREAVGRLEEDQTEAVWEEMVKRAGDRRYCQTVTSCCTGDAAILDVGTLCERLAWSRLVGVFWKHLPREGLGGKQPFLHVGVWDSTLAEWRKKRAAKALYELQVEVCEEAIKVLEAMPKDRISDAVKKQFRKKVEAEIVSLKKTKKPVHIRSGYYFFEVWGQYNEKIAAQVRQGVKTGKYDPGLINK
jgi:hypothetical protein